MAEKEFVIYKKARELFNSMPRNAALLNELEVLSDEAGDNTLEAKMIGNLISGTLLEMHESDK